MFIFSGLSNEPLATSIAEILGKKLSPIEVFVFPDGEKRITIGENVVGKTALIVQSTNEPVNENYMELLLIVDAIKRSGAEFVKLLMPYMGYQRQDHVFRDGEGASLEVVIKMLESAGICEFIAFDLHTIRIPELFQIPARNLTALPIFAQKIKNNFLTKNIVLVSPDMGGIRRIKQMSEILNIPYATIIKDRDLNKGEIEDVGLNGEVNGKIAIIVDDMISTGKTMIHAADMLIEKGATNVVAFATHAIFSKDAHGLLENSKIEKIYVTDTVRIPEEKYFPKLEILSIAKTAADALANS